MVLEAFREVKKKYLSKASGFNFTKEFFKSMRPIEWFVAFIILVCIAFFSYMYVTDGKLAVVWTPSLAASTFILLYYFYHIKNYRFGLSFNVSNDSLHRNARYSLFKDELDELFRENKSKKDISKWVPLIDSEIELISNSAIIGKRVGTIGISFTMAVIIVILKAIDNTQVLVNVLMGGAAVFVLVQLFTLLIRTDEELLRELKLFLLVYDNEP